MLENVQLRLKFFCVQEIEALDVKRNIAHKVKQ